MSEIRLSGTPVMQLVSHTRRRRTARDALQGAVIATPTGSTSFMVDESVRVVVQDHGHVIAAGSEPVAELLGQLDDIKKRVAYLEAELRGHDVREITETQARQEIAAYFEKNDGKVLYPSDVAESLRLDYDLVSKVIEGLAKDGEIAEADKA